MYKLLLLKLYLYCIGKVSNSSKVNMIKWLHQLGLIIMDLFGFNTTEPNCVWFWSLIIHECRTVKYYGLHSTIDFINPIWALLVHLRYSLGGDRPSQITNHTLSEKLLVGYFNKSGISKTSKQFTSVKVLTITTNLPSNIYLSSYISPGDKVVVL